MAFQTSETYPAAAAYPAVASFPASASFPSAYDPDAVAYFSASGVTDQTQRLNISQFITALKKNSLWGLFPEIWLLKSAQNAGSGTTVFGLKGAWNGSFNGSPTWGAGGISFSGANVYVVISGMAAPVFNGNGGCSFGYICTTVATSQMFAVVSIGTTANCLAASMNRNQTTGALNTGEFGFTINNAAKGLRSTGNTLTGTRHLQGSYTNPISSGDLIMDGVVLSESVMDTFSILSANGDVRFGNTAGVNISDHTLSIVYLSNKRLTTSQLQTIVTCYNTSAL